MSQFSKAEKLPLNPWLLLKSGDEWISILIRLSLELAHLDHKYESAQRYLASAESSALRVKDTFTLCVSRLWLAIKAWQQGYQNTAFSYFEKCLALIIEHGYDFILTRETLIGLKDREAIYPLVLAAYSNGVESNFLNLILHQRGISGLDYHPGYTLWVQTFGNFNVWRGDHLIDIKDWKREKARQFFQILVVQRGKWVHKDQIYEWL